MAQTTKLQIEGMPCANCAVHVEKALEAVPGVTQASVTLDEGAEVHHNGVNHSDLLRAIAAAGSYKAHVAP